MPVLIDATSNRQLRANEFVAASSDPIGLEEEVASGVLKMLEIELEPKEQPSFNRKDTNESSAYAHYLRGRGYLEEFQKPENIDSAISEFKGALEQDPYYARALAGLGEAYWHKYEAVRDREWSLLAKTNCERAVSLAGSESAGHACLGQVLFGTGEYQQAAQEYERAVQLEPTNDEAIRGLANTFDKLGNTRQAEVTYRKAIALRPNNWLTYNSLGGFYSAHGRYPEAAEMFAKVVLIAPDSFRGWSNLGGTYVNEGRYQEGIETVQHSISIRPTYRAYSNLATAYFDLRRFDDAAREYTLALQQDDRDYVVWGNLGDACDYSGDKAGASAAYRKAITLARESLEVNPKDARTLGNLALYYSDIKDGKLASQTIDRALQFAPSDLDVLLDAALVHNSSGDIEQTLHRLKRALKQGLSPETVRDAPAFDKLRGDARFRALLGH
jgi:tetratricopeptide (TPR) repeat protein